MLKEIIEFIYLFLKMDIVFVLEREYFGRVRLLVKGRGKRGVFCIIKW